MTYVLEWENFSPSYSMILISWGYQQWHQSKDEFWLSSTAEVEGGSCLTSNIEAPHKGCVNIVFFFSLRCKKLQTDLEQATAQDESHLKKELLESEPPAESTPSKYWILGMHTLPQVCFPIWNRPWLWLTSDPEWLLLGLNSSLITVLKRTEKNQRTLHLWHCSY